MWMIPQRIAQGGAAVVWSALAGRPAGTTAGSEPDAGHDPGHAASIRAIERHPEKRAVGTRQPFVGRRIVDCSLRVSAHIFHALRYRSCLFGSPAASQESEKRSGSVEDVGLLVGALRTGATGGHDRGHTNRARRFAGVRTRGNTRNGGSRERSLIQRFAIELSPSGPRLREDKSGSR